MPQPLRICFVASECTPLAKTGGLADVVGALSRYLHEQGHDIRPFLPFYSSIDTANLTLTRHEALSDIPLTLGSNRYRFSIVVAELPGSTLKLNLVHCPALYDRPGLYTGDADEHLRFLVLTRAAIEACRRLKFAPQVFHCHDWHTAFGPLYLKALPTEDRLFAATRSVLTIHNIGYQGHFSAAARADLGLSTVEQWLDRDDLHRGELNALRHGIMHAHTITTVSPTYAREILTDEYGMGLQGALRARHDEPVGILNGVDYRDWDPATDHHLPALYDANRLEGKQTAKQALLARMKLDLPPGAPLLGIVSRMARQKGFELLFDTLPNYLSTRPVALAVLGSGESRYEDYFASMQHAFPGRVAFHRGYDDALAHLIEAGSDMFLMPSQYEPCGLNQMYSLRYGTVPIVRRTGGLADSVQHFDPGSGVGTGVVFNDYDVGGINWALGTALAWYEDKPAWRQLMLNGMAQDYSWNKQGKEYEALYRSVL